MAADISVTKVNEVYVKVECEKSIGAELGEYFTFEVPGAKFTPQFRNRLWDGKIRLFNRQTRLIYHGLTDYINTFAEERGYSTYFHNDVIATENFSAKEALDFIDSLNLMSRGQSIKIHDYQAIAFTKAVRAKRKLLVSPTASGKSLIAYLFARYFDHLSGIIIVPTTSLVEQLYKDFADYSSGNGWNVDEHVHKIYSGFEKHTRKRIIITTWQSVYKMPKEYFEGFGFVIGDEAHLFKAKSLTEILSKLENCSYRIGMTGTLDGTQTHRLVLEGLFGPVMQVTTTADLMKDKKVAELVIKALVLQYPDAVCKEVSKMDYQKEVDYLVKLEARNKFIRNLALSLNGNTLILYQFVEKHGEVLYNMISEKAGDRKVFFVHGGVDATDREEIRSITEGEQNGIIVASFGTFSTGINIRNLHNIVFASPSKSRIRNLQSIGRGLRLGSNKDQATLLDIIDNLQWKERENFALKHGQERLRIYDSEEFNYKVYNITLKV